MARAENKNDLSKKIMDRIKKEKVQMKPKAYFVIGSLLLAMGLFGSFIFSSLFMNFFIFRLRSHNPFFYLHFGRRGISPFFTAFPWIAFLSSIVLLIAGIYFLKKHEISYKRSFLVIVLTVLASAFGTAILLNKVGVNRRLANEKLAAPFLHPKFSSQNFVVGEVMEIGDEGMVIATPEGSRVNVKWNEKTKMPRDFEFEVGDKIRAVGDAKNGEFEADGIAKGGFRWDQNMPDPKGGFVKGYKMNDRPKRR